MKTIEVLEDLHLSPGKVHEAQIQVANLPDTTEIHIPLLVGEGSQKGPTILITALIHGVEIGGYEVIRRLMLEEIDFNQIKGRVIAVPIVNPFALFVSNRFTPQDSADLNRFFPGNANGTLSQRIAHILSQRIVPHANYVIDFHSCNPPSEIFTIVNIEGSKETQETSRAMAKAFGAITVAPSQEVAGTFSGYLSSIGKPVITPELVFSRRFDPNSTDVGVLGTLNVMKYLGMLKGEIQALPQTERFTEVFKYTALYANAGGFVHFVKNVKDYVEEGEVFATIRNPWGVIIEEMCSPVKGRIIAYPMAGNQSLTTGDKVAYFASTQ